MKGVTSLHMGSMCLYGDLKLVVLSYEFLFATETQSLATLFSKEMHISRFIIFIHNDEYRERNLNMANLGLSKLSTTLLSPLT